MEKKGEINIKCRCGATISETTAQRQPDRKNVLVCGNCGLNHEFTTDDKKPKLRLRYYFPDD